MIRLKLRDLVKLPSPKDLGKSEYNALPMRCITDTNDYCWEDWEVEVKKDYPIRYFLSETLSDVAADVARPFKKAHYWLVSHTIRRYHLLDLREKPTKSGVNNFDYYRYGWIDSDHQMVLALFKILNNFMEHEFKSLYCPTEEDILKNPYDKVHADFYHEIQAIHHWWNVQRLEEQEAILELSRNLSVEDLASDDRKDLRRLINEKDKQLEDKQEEMILRLLKIRKCMWT